MDRRRCQQLQEQPGHQGRRPALRQVRRDPEAAHRQDPAGPDPRRLAGRLPVAVQLPRPVLKTGASANYEEYTNPEFDKLLTEGLAAKSTDDANKKFTQAQEILFQDLPNLPLWYQARQAVWSQNVSNVDSGWNGVLQYCAITAK